jgi:hypothetical protein
MAAVPIKFRCYRCHQLLGVARSKAGAVVACPKCSAELVVPQPSEPVTGPASADVTASFEARTDGGDPGLSLDFLDIRPEDIRVEPGLSSVRNAEPARAPAVEPDRVEERVQEDRGVDDWERAVAPTIDPPAPPPAAAEPVLPSEAPVPAPEKEVIPAIRVDAPIKRGAANLSPASTRGRDLILPRSVVAAWSLFVLLALAFAFLAGLLAGHYVWRVH